MATVDSFVMQLSGIDADLARRITSSVLGMMISELMSGAPKREHVESYINELAAWMNDYAPAQ